MLVRLLLAACALALLGAALVQDSTPEALPSAKERTPLRLTYLANEGFLIEVEDERVLIDAFVETPYVGYPALPKKLAAKLRKAEAPFDDIDLALTSHVHADHFQPVLARDFMLAASETPLASTKQVVAAIGEATRDREALEGRLFGHYPEAGKLAELEFGELRVRYLRAPHGGRPEIENLGTLLDIGGHIVLHLGDAAMERDIYAPHAKLLAEVDLALVPFWFFADERGRAIVEEFLPESSHVAMHFAKRNLAKTVASFLESHASVHAFTEALEGRTYE